MPRWTGGAKKTTQQLIAIEFLRTRERSNRAGAHWQSADCVCDDAAARCSAVSVIRRRFWNR
jgi:hypothetical protein